MNFSTSAHSNNQVKGSRWNAANNKIEEQESLSGVLPDPFQASSGKRRNRRAKVPPSDAAAQLQVCGKQTYEEGSFEYDYAGTHLAEGVIELGTLTEFVSAALVAG